MGSMITGNSLLLAGNWCLRASCLLQKQGLQQESLSFETTSDGALACPWAQTPKSLIQRPEAE